jgi:hypothetical protein
LRSAAGSADIIHSYIQHTRVAGKKNIHTHVNTYIHTHMCIHTYRRNTHQHQAKSPVVLLKRRYHIYIHSYTYTHTRTHTYMHAPSRKTTHTHLNTYIHIHTYVQNKYPSASGKIAHRIAQASLTDESSQNLSFKGFAAFCNGHNLDVKIHETTEDLQQLQHGCFGGLVRRWKNGFKLRGSHFSKVVPA